MVAGLVVVLACLVEALVALQVRTPPLEQRCILTAVHVVLQLVNLVELVEHSGYLLTTRF